MEDFTFIVRNIINSPVEKQMEGAVTRCSFSFMLKSLWTHARNDN